MQINNYPPEMDWFFGEHQAAFEVIKRIYQAMKNDSQQNRRKRLRQIERDITVLKKFYLTDEFIYKILEIQRRRIGPTAKAFWLKPKQLLIWYAYTFWRPLAQVEPSETNGFMDLLDSIAQKCGEEDLIDFKSVQLTLKKIREHGYNPYVRPVLPIALWLQEF